MATHPITVTLRFKSAADREAFMSGLSDGWGEDHCQLNWPADNWSLADQRSGKAFEECDMFDVIVFRDEEEEA